MLVLIIIQLVHPILVSHIHSQGTPSFHMDSSIKIENCKGDSKIHPTTWWQKFKQWIDLYNVPSNKATNVLAFQLSDEAETWYHIFPPDITRFGKI